VVGRKKSGTGGLYRVCMLGVMISNNGDIGDTKGRCIR